MLFPASVCVDAVVDATGFSPEERNESTTATQSSAANPPITAQVQCIWQRFPVIDFRSLSCFGVRVQASASLGSFEPCRRPSASVRDQDFRPSSRADAEVELPHELHSEPTRLELDLYLRVWQSLHEWSAVEYVEEV